MALGGRAAEKLKLDDISTGAYSDLQNATQAAHKMVTEYGMSDSIGPIFLGSHGEVFLGRDFGQQRNYSEDLAARVDEEVRKILDTQFERAMQAIGEDMDALDRVAKALMERERVTGEEFKAIYFGTDAEKKTQPAAEEEIPQQEQSGETDIAEQDAPAQEAEGPENE